MAINKITQWKRENKFAACTKAPWEQLIPIKDRANIILKIKQETIDAYGYSLNECPKRKTCLTKDCMGRPLPWLSKTAVPFLEQLKERFTIKRELLYINTDCDLCPIVKECTATCSTIYDTLSKNKADDQVNLEFAKEITPMVEPAEIEVSEGLIVGDLAEIPWDCLTKRKRKVVIMYVLEQKDYLHIAQKVGLYNQAAAKYEFYSALTKLSKFANFRKFIIDNKTSLSTLQYKILRKAFFNNKNYVEISKEIEISPQAIQQIIAKLIKEHKIKWQVYVKKQNGKLIYNVPGIMK